MICPHCGQSQLVAERVPIVTTVDMVCRVCGYRDIGEPADNQRLGVRSNGRNQRPRYQGMRL